MYRLTHTTVPKALWVSIFPFIFCISCAKIPVQSVQLVDVLQEEGKKMHDLNRLLINTIFEAKKAQVLLFIEKQYIPAFMENYYKVLPNKAFTKTESIEIVQAALPIIKKRESDAMQVLENNRVKLLTTISDHYLAYQNGTAALKSLLVSAVKLETEKGRLVQSSNRIFRTNIDLNVIEKKLDSLTKDISSLLEQ